MTHQALKLIDVNFSYETAPVLSHIHLSIPTGQFVTLLGSSGCGKSTLLRMLAGLQRPDSGHLLWQGRPISGPSLQRSIVFQDYALFPWMNVIDNVALALGKARPHNGKAERRNSAARYLQMVGLENVLHQYPHELSGGMRQRGAIARALAQGAPLLLMDEPFGALDPVNRARLQDVLLSIWEQSIPRRTIVFVTHDIDEALYLSDRIIILGATPGRILSDISVGFPRHRQRDTLFEQADFHQLRESIAETLAHDTLEQLATV